SYTTEELLALPEDGVERELIQGQLREKPMTKRNPTHSGVTVNVAHALKQWLVKQPIPRGRALAGEAGVRIRTNPHPTGRLAAATHLPGFGVPVTEIFEL